jgi:hypothetical protein
VRLFGWYIGREREPAEVERVVEKVTERVILGTPAPVTVYRVNCPRYESDNRLHGIRLQSWAACNTFRLSASAPEAMPEHPKPPAWEGQYFHTCEQAFAAHPGAKVTSVSGWKVGDEFVTGLEVRPLTVQPKPKVAKGKRA